MDAFEHEVGSNLKALSSAAGGGVLGGEPLVQAVRAKEPWLHRQLDWATAWLLCLGIVFCPLAFGTTQAWSIDVMNAVGFLLGGLLAAKWIVRWRTGWRPVGSTEDLVDGSGRGPSRASRWLTRGLAVLTVLLLAYVLVGALNARATFSVQRQTIDYYDCIPWLPHSYDRPATWFFFWEYAGLACLFWSVRDWLRRAPAEDSSPAWSGQEHQASAHGRHGHHGLHRPMDVIPGRLKLLLMVVCATGALAGLEGIVQRLAMSDKLLFLVQARFNSDCLCQFGPYASRNSAAEYFNLVWPVCAGVAWLMGEAAARARKAGVRRPGKAQWWLALAALVTGVCPVMSGSRGGGLVSLAMVVAVLVVMLAIPRRMAVRQKIGLGLLFAVALEGAVLLGWENLRSRLEDALVDGLSGRVTEWKNARAMANGNAMFGMGAGTFASMYYFYMKATDIEWAAYAHDDWLEFRITLGWIGFGLLLALLAGAVALGFLGRGPPWPRLLVAVMLIAMAGCLFHARFDMPFRIHSVAALFLLYCGILSSGRMA